MANNNNKSSNNNNMADCTITALETLLLSNGHCLRPHFSLYIYTPIYICLYIYRHAVCRRSVMIYWHATRRSLPEMCVQSAILMGERRGVGGRTALLRLLPPSKLRYHSIRLLHTTVNKFALPSLCNGGVERSSHSELSGT